MPTKKSILTNRRARELTRHYLTDAHSIINSLDDEKLDDDLQLAQWLIGIAHEAIANAQNDARTAVNRNSGAHV